MTSINSNHSEPFSFFAFTSPYPIPPNPPITNYQNAFNNYLKSNPNETVVEINCADNKTLKTSQKLLSTTFKFYSQIFQSWTNSKEITEHCFTWKNEDTSFPVEAVAQVLFFALNFTQNNQTHPPYLPLHLHPNANDLLPDVIHLADVYEAPPTLIQECLTVIQSTIDQEAANIWDYHAYADLPGFMEILDHWMQGLINAPSSIPLAVFELQEHFKDHASPSLLAFACLTWMHIMQKESENAESILTLGLSIYGSNPFLLWIKGNGLFRLKQYEEAIKAFSAVLITSPDYLPALMGRSEAYYATDKSQYRQPAMRDLDKILNRYPNHVYALARKASIEDLRANIRDASVLIVQASKIEPENALVKKVANQIQDHITKVWKEITEKSQLIGDHPNCSQHWCNRGLCYKSLGMEEEAQADFQKALEINPQDPSTLIFQPYLLIRI